MKDRNFASETVNTLSTVLKIYFWPDEQPASDEAYYAELDINQ